MNMRKHLRLTNLLVFLGALLILFFLTNNISVTRNVIAVQIENSIIKSTLIGFEHTNLYSTFSTNNPRGILILYIEARNPSTNEVVYSNSLPDVGMGTVLILGVEYPKVNSSWNIRFDLKDASYRILSTRCYQVNFYIKDANQKEIGQNEKSC
jgi:hypothetical protein